MYFGESQTVLDDKGRITLPRRLRDKMDAYGHVIWYMTRGFDKSVFVFPKEEWDRIRAQAAQHSSMDASAIDFRRLFYGGMTEVRPDRQGRIPIPSHLREHAGLTKEVVLIGVEDHLELWSREGWRAFQEGKEAEFKDVASRVFATPGSGPAGAQAGG